MSVFRTLLINNAQQGGLPAGYTQVDYIQNTAQTSISTCFKTGIYTDVDDFEMEIKVMPTTGNWFILGVQQSGGYSNYLGIRGASSYSTLIGSVPNGVNISWRNGRLASNTYLMTLTYKNGNASLVSKNLTNDTEQSGTATYTYVDTINEELQLFWSVSSGNKVYSVKIKKSGVLVADYVPAIDSNNVAGFWDKATKSFKTALDTSIYTGVTL